MLLDRCALISIYRNLSFHEGNQSKYKKLAFVHVETDLKHISSWAEGFIYGSLDIISSNTFVCKMIAYVLTDCRKICEKPNLCLVPRNPTLGPSQRLTLIEDLGFKNP